MFVHRVSLDVMEVPVVQIIRMSIRLDCGVTTAWAVRMGVIFMCFAITHSNAFLFH